MANKNSDQPAFANSGIEGRFLSSGLTKRELAAFMAMQGLCANQKFYEIASEKLDPDTIADFYSVCAVEQADSILTELDK